MYRAAVFDLDKTLVETDPAYFAEAFDKTLRGFGIMPSNEIIRGLVMCHDHERILAGLGLDCATFWSAHDKNDTAQGRIACTRPYSDASIIYELRDRGLLLGIVTGSPPKTARLQTGLVGLEHFHSIVSAQEQIGIPYKPHPRSLELCLEELGVAKHEAFYVGNGIEDIRLGRNAGVYTFFIDRGEHETLPLVPDCTLKSLYELRDALLWSPGRTYSPPASHYENRPACRSKPCLPGPGKFVS